jgi:hypothetical protein
MRRSLLPNADDDHDDDVDHDDHNDCPLPDGRKLSGLLRIPECTGLYFMLLSQRLWQQPVRSGSKCRLHRRKSERELRRRAQPLRVRFRLLPDGDEHDKYDDSPSQLPRRRKLSRVLRISGCARLRHLLLRQGL